MSQDLERLVLRKRYAASSFAKQVRALVPQHDSGVEAGVPVEIEFGQRDASTVVAEGTPRLAPPPPPPPATLPAAAPALVSALMGALRGARASWLPALLPTAATLVLMVIVLRHGGTAQRMPAAPPPPGRTPMPVAAACATPVVPSGVELSIDSRPQGALVSAAATPTERARPLGETPCAFRVPRGETPMTLVVSKRGFASVSFKVVPNRDKDVETRLERGSGGSRLVASTQRRMLSANLPVGSSPSDRARRLPR